MSKRALRAERRAAIGPDGAHFVDLGRPAPPRGVDRRTRRTGG